MRVSQLATRPHGAERLLRERLDARDEGSLLLILNSKNLTSGAAESCCMQPSWSFPPVLRGYLLCSLIRPFARKLPQPPGTPKERMNGSHIPKESAARHGMPVSPSLRLVGVLTVLLQYALRAPSVARLVSKGF